MFLIYGGDDELVARGYTDASFTIDPDDFKSQSGYVFTLNGGAVSWKSSKQDTLAVLQQKRSTSQRLKPQRRVSG